MLPSCRPAVSKWFWHDRTLSWQHTSFARFCSMARQRCENGSRFRFCQSIVSLSATYTAAQLAKHSLSFSQSPPSLSLFCAITFAITFVCCRVVVTVETPYSHNWLPTISNTYLEAPDCCSRRDTIFSKMVTNDQCQRQKPSSTLDAFQNNTYTHFFKSLLLDHRRFEWSVMQYFCSLARPPEIWVIGDAICILCSFARPPEMLVIGDAICNLYALYALARPPEMWVLGDATCVRTTWESFLVCCCVSTSILF